MRRRQQLLNQVRLHQRSFWRNPESAFFNFAMPLGVLLIFGATSTRDTVPGRAGVGPLTLFVPGILAFAIVVTAYGNLAASLASQRADGVLKRVRATPLSPSLYIGGQLAGTLVTAMLIATATIALGASMFGAVPRAEAIPQLLITLALGIVCFTALGIAVSAAIRTADAANAITNGTYLPLAMVSGMVSTGLHLPPAVNTIVTAFPLKALADGLRSAYDPAAHDLPIGSLLVLTAWAAAGIGLAHRYFRWQPQ